MTLPDGQYQYGSFLFGTGTNFGIRSIDGLENMTVRSGDRELPRGHGSVPGPHYVAAKDPVFELVVRNGGSAATLAARLAELREAFQVDSDAAHRPLTWKRPGMPERVAYLAPIAVAHAESFETVDRVAFPRVALTAADPRIYSSVVRTVALNPYDPGGGGIDYSWETYPQDWPAGTPGDGVANNAGNSNAYPTLKFYGPTDAGTLTSVSVRNMTTGQLLTVTTAITTGQILQVDNLAHVTGSGAQVVGLDGSSRYGDWQQPREPFVLVPGDNVVRYETVGTTAETQCALVWRDTWL